MDEENEQQTLVCISLCPGRHMGEKLDTVSRDAHVETQSPV